MSQRWQTDDLHTSHRQALAALADAHNERGRPPAPPAGPDDPMAWTVLPATVAPFRCWVCHYPFHVRRHWEAHRCR